MFRYRITAVVFFLITSLGTAAYGGKLGSIRNKAGGSSTPTSSSSSEDHDDRESERQQRRQPAPRRERKLESVRSATRRESPRRHETPRSSDRVSSRSRPTHAHGRRRPNRSGANLGFFFDSAPSCEPMTTVVEEYHYYPNSPFPVAPVATVAVPQSLTPEAVYEQAPVMPAEPAIFDSCDEFTTAPTTTVIAAQDPFLADFNLRFEIDSASDEDDVNRSGFGLLFNATGGLGIDTGVRIFREQDADFRDHMWIGDFNIVYELFPTEFARTRAGVGFNWLADRYGSEGGLNLTLGSDLFAGPLVFSGEADLGTLGDADLFHGRLTVAARPGQHLEIFAGYDYLDIGGIEIKGVVGGIRFRF